MKREKTKVNDSFDEKDVRLGTEAEVESQKFESEQNV